MKKYFKAPEIYNKDKPIAFLAGAIDMGLAEMWQNYVVDKLSHLDLIILNPRRDNWDVSLKQTKETPEFLKQVKWELKGQDDADVIIFVFPAHAKAPITFLELGLALGKKKCFVYAHPGFYRKGNVEITCELFNVPVYNDIDQMLSEFKDYFRFQMSDELNKI